MGNYRTAGKRGKNKVHYSFRLFAFCLMFLIHRVFFIDFLKKDDLILRWDFLSFLNVSVALDRFEFFSGALR